MAHSYPLNTLFSILSRPHNSSISPVLPSDDSLSLANSSLANPANERDFLAVLMFISGLFVCFSGQKLFRPSIVLCSAILSSYSAFVLVSTHVQFTAAMESIVVFTAGLAGAIAALTILELGIFFLGSSFGLLISNLFFQLFHGWAGIQTHEILVRVLFLCCSGLLFGLFALFCFRPLANLFTSFIGSYFLTSAISHFLYRIDVFPVELFVPELFFNSPEKFQCFSSEGRIGSLCYGFSCLWLVLFLTGLFVQCTASVSSRSRLDDYEEIRILEHRRREKNAERVGLLEENRNNNSYGSQPPATRR